MAATARVEQRLQAIERSLLYRVLLAFQPVGIILAVLAVWVDVLSRNDARTISAWQLLTTQASGNSGKKQALEYLNNSSWWRFWGGGQALDGIDLRPPVGGAGAYLVDLQLPHASLSGARFDEAVAFSSDFSGASLDEAAFRGARLSEASFKSAILSSTDFSGAFMQGASFSDASGHETIFQGARLGDTSFRSAWLSACRCDGIQTQTLRTEGTMDVTDAHFEGGSFRGSAMRLIGTRAVFLGGDISGAALVTVPGATIAGYAWALTNNPALGVPAGVRYFECEESVSDTEIFDVNDALALDGLNEFAALSKADVPLQLPDHCTPIDPPVPHRGSASP